MVERDGARGARTPLTGRGWPAAAASSPGRPAASAPRSPARSPPRAPPSACSTSTADVKAVAAELDGAGRGRRPRRPARHPARRSGGSIAALGGVDVLVNNAGILRITPLLDITVEEWDLVIDVNARSMLRDDPGRRPGDDRRRRAAAGSSTWRAWAPSAAGAEPGPLRRVQGGGRGADPGGGDRARPARHHRQRDLPRLRAHRDGRRHPHRPRWSPAWSATSPLGRCAEPADVAAMALFLASDDAAYCTGQAINVTGGMMMH